MMLLKCTFLHLWTFPFLSASPSISLAHQTAVKYQLVDLVVPLQSHCFWSHQDGYFVRSHLFYSLSTLSSLLLQGPLYLSGCLIIKRYFQVRVWVMLYHTASWKSLKFITQVRCGAALMAHPWQTAWITSVKKEMWELAVCVDLRKICPRRHLFPRDHSKKDNNYQPDSTVAGELQRLSKHGRSQLECVVHY